MGHPPEALQAAQEGKALYCLPPARAAAACRPCLRCSRVHPSYGCRATPRPPACSSAPDSHDLVAASLVLGVCFLVARSLKVALCVPAGCPCPWPLHRLALLAQPSRSRCLPSAAGWMVWCRSALVIMFVSAAATFVALNQGGCSAVLACTGAGVGAVATVLTTELLPPSRPYLQALASTCMLACSAAASLTWPCTPWCALLALFPMSLAGKRG